MAKIIPFCGLRPAPELAAGVASHPYDVLDSDEARELVKENPLSFLHIVKPEVDVDSSISLYDSAVYAKGKENFTAFRKKSILQMDSRPVFYVYKQIMGSHEQTGIVACASVDEYQSNAIKRHEHTRPEKVQDRLNLMNALHAQTGPIFLAFRQTKKVAKIIAETMKNPPVNDFTSFNNIRHIFYVMDDEKLITELQSAFASVDALYIADGHHRTEVAAQYCLQRRAELGAVTGDEQFNYFLSVIFPSDQLLILAYNRVVKDLNGLSVDQFMIKVNELFLVKEAPKDFKGPGHKNEFGLYIAGKWFVLKAGKKIAAVADVVESLDVSILQNNILDPLLGIKDPRTDTRIKFVGGIKTSKELAQLVDSGKFAVAFALYPTHINEVMDVADAGKVMPPKSTWFEPKLLSGLVTHVLD